MRPLLWLTIVMLLLRGTTLYAPPMFADDEPPSIAAPDSDPSTDHVANRLTPHGLAAIRLFDGSSFWLTTDFSTYQVGYVRSKFSLARDCARKTVDHSPLHAQSVLWQI